jgi:hypothetical protein
MALLDGIFLQKVNSTAIGAKQRLKYVLTKQSIYDRIKSRLFKGIKKFNPHKS